jgi:hypothetical protein
MCAGDDWDQLGAAEVDRLAEYLDAAEKANDSSTKDECLVCAAKEVEMIEQRVRKRIEDDLSKYT